MWKYYSTSLRKALPLHKVSKNIPIKKGIRQGDTISTKLFTAIRKLLRKFLRTWNGKRQEFRYIKNN